MKPFHFIPLKYQDFWEREVEFKIQKSLFKSVKNISVLNVLVLIKMGVQVKIGISSTGCSPHVDFDKQHDQQSSTTRMHTTRP